MIPTRATLFKLCTLSIWAGLKKFSKHQTDFEKETVFALREPRREQRGNVINPKPSKYMYHPLPKHWSFGGSGAFYRTFSASVLLFMLWGVTVSVQAQAQGIKNCAQVQASGTPDPDSTPNNLVGSNPAEDDEACVMSMPIYDLALRKTLANGQSASVTPGANVNYTLTIFNQGAADGGQFIVTDHIPDGMSYVSASGAGFNCGGSGQIVQCQYNGSFPAGETRTIGLVLRVDNPALAPFRNWAEISSDSGDDVDSTPDTNTGSDTTTGTGTPPNDTVVNDVVDNNGTTDEDDNDYEDVDVSTRYDLALIKELANGQSAIVQPNANVNYKITVKNQGNVGSGVFTVTDTIPTGMSYVSASGSNYVCSNAGQVVTCNFSGNLLPTETSQINLTLQVTNTTFGPFRNHAEISSDSGNDPDSTPDTNTGSDTTTGTGTPPNDPVNNTNNIDYVGADDEDDQDYEDVSVNAIYDLALVKTLATGQSSQVLVGQNVNYTITVKNQGNVPSGVFTVTDTIPTGMSYVSASGINYTCAAVGQVVTCNYSGSLQPNQTVPFTLTVRVDDAAQGPFRNQAEISSDSGDDIDSTPDTNTGSDTTTGTGTPPNDNVNNTNMIDYMGADDEDDQDYEDVGIMPMYDLALIKTLAAGQSATVSPGANVNYVITVKNQGNVTSGNFAVTDQIPTGMSFVSASGTGYSCNHSLGRVTCASTADLAVGASNTINLTLRVDDASFAPFVNWAEISSDGAVQILGTGGRDKDSTPDVNVGNDTTAGNGTLPNDAVNNTNNIDYIGSDDEDDNDFEAVNVQTRYDLALIKTLAAGQTPIVTLGGTADFTITVKNQGDIPSGVFTVTDRLPAGTTFVSASGSNFNCSGSGNIATCNFTGNLQPGQTATFNLRLQVTDPTTRPFRNWAEISSDSGDDVDSTPDTNTGGDDVVGSGTPPNDPVNNTNNIDYVGADDEDDNDFEEIDTTVRYDLALVKTLAAGQEAKVSQGQIVKYTITVKNQGNVASGAFMVKDRIPAGMTYVSATGTGYSCAYDGAGVVTCSNTNTLLPNQTLDFELQVRVTDRTQAPFRNWAEIAVDSGDDVDSTPDLNTGNDTGTGVGTPPNDPVNNTNQIDYMGADDEDDNDPEDVQIKTADLSIRKIADKAETCIGDPITYTITVTNDGPDDATGVTVRDVLPAQLRLLSTIPSNVYDGQTWVIGTIPAGQSRQLNITAEVLALGVITNTAQIATVNEYDPDSTPGNNSTSEDDDDGVNVTSVEKVDLQLDKTASVARLLVGENVTYTLTLRNNSARAATNVSVEDRLTNGLFFISASDPSYNPTAGDYVWNIATVPANGSVSLTIVARADRPGELCNHTEVVGSAIGDIDSTPANGSTNEDDDSHVCILVEDPNAKLTITKSVDKPTANVGDQVTYLINVRNDGNGPARNVEIRDAEALSNLTAVTYSINGGAPQVMPANGVITLAAPLNPAQSATIRIVGTVPASSQGKILENVAQVYSPDDPNGPQTTPPVKTCVGTANVVIEKAVDKATANTGEVVTYTLTIRNIGMLPATTVLVGDQQAMQLTSPTYTVGGDATAASGNWTGNISLTSFAGGGLAPGEVATVTIRGTIPANRQGTILNNSATVSSPQDPGGEEPSNPVQTVVGLADLAIRKRVDKTAAQVGDQLTYTLTITNNGTLPAQTVTVADGNAVTALTNPTYAVSGDATGSGNWTGSITLTAFTGGGLAQGESFDVVITGTIPAGRQGTLIENHATAASPQDPTGQVTSETVETVVGTAALRIAKTVNRTTGQVGDTVEYTLTIRNEGNANATTVNVNDAGALQLTSPTYAVSGDASGSGNWTGSLSLTPTGGLAPGEVITVRISGTIPATRQGTVIANQATVSSPQDPSGPVTSDPVTTTVGTAKLEVNKIVNRTTASNGDTITYTITVRNTGTANATSVTVNDANALKLTNPTYTLGGDASGSGAWTGSLNVTPNAGLAQGESFTVTITGTVPAALQGTSLVNTANVQSPQDPTGPTTSLPVETTIGLADLAINKTVNRTAAMPGDVVTYTIKVTNNGTNPATSVTVNDANALVLTSPTYTISGDATGSGSWTGSVTVSPTAGLAQGESFDVVISGTVPQTAQGNIIENVASANSPQDPTGPVISTPVTTTVGAASLRIAKSVDKVIAQPGETISYTLIVRNEGSANATVVNVSDTQALVLTNPAYSISGDATGSGTWTGNLAINPTGGLAPGETINITITGTVPSGRLNTVIENQATVSSPQDPAGPKTSTTVQTVIGSAKLNIQKTVNRTSAQPGDSITYTVTARNVGTAAATTLTLSDAGALALTNPTYALSGDATGSGSWTGSVTVNPTGGLQTNEVVTLTITGTVPANAQGTVLENVAQAASPQDPSSPVTSTPVQTVINLADIAIRKTVDKSAAQVGETLTYRLTVTNNGNAAATTVHIYDGNAVSALVNPTYTISGDATGSGSWTGSVSVNPNGGLVQGENVVVTITGTIPANLQGRVIENVATANSPQDPTGQVTSEPVTTVVGTAAVRMTKSVNRTSAQPGDAITYTLTIRNEGMAAATTINVSDQDALALNSPTYVVSGDATGSGSWTGSLSLTPNAGLNPGETITIAITGTVPSNRLGTVIRNTATVSSPQDPSGPTTTPPVETVIGTAKLEALKSVNRVTAQPGDQVIYTIVVRNSGTASATTVTVNDQNALRLNNPTYVLGGDATGSGTWSGTLVVTPGGGLQPNETFSVTITGTVPANLQGQILTNTATIISPQDPSGPTTTPPVETAIGTAKLVATKTVNRQNAFVGDQIVYNITVTNVGNAAATSLNIQDSNALVLNNPTYTVSGDASGSGNWTGVLNLTPNGGLSTGESVTVTITGTVPQNRAGTTIVNTATVTSPQDPSSPVTTPPVQTQILTPKIGIAKRVVSVLPVANNRTEVTFRFAVENLGNEILSNIQVLDNMLSTFGAAFDGITQVPTALSSGLVMNTAYNGNGNMLGAGNILNPGDFKEFTVKVRINPAAQAGPYYNVATVNGTAPNGSTVTDTSQDGANPDPDGDDDATDNNEPTPVNIPTDLMVMKTVDRENVMMGENVTFTVSVANNGPGVATNVKVLDKLPEGLIYQSHTTNIGQYDALTGVWNVGTLTVGQGASIKVIARMTGTSPVVNTAVLYSLDQTDTNPNNNGGKVTVTPADMVDLAITKEVDNARAIAGDVVTFTLRVRNDGPSNATGVRVTDQLQTQGFQYLSHIASDASDTYNPITGVWNVGAIDNGQTATLTLRAIVTGQSILTNVATITTIDQPDGDPSDNTAMVTVASAQAQVDLAVSVYANGQSSASVRNGDNVNFEIQVTNNGPNGATGIRIQELLPAGFTYVSSTPQTGTYDPVSMVWSIPSLANGATTRLNVIATATRNGTVANAARVITRNEFDRNPANDFGTATVYVDAGILQADIKVVKLVDNAIPAVGSEIVYKVYVQNFGPNRASGIEVTDILPNTVTFVSADKATYNPLNNDNVWNVGSLSVGASDTLNVRVRVNGMEPTTNFAVATLNEWDTTQNVGSVTITPRMVVQCDEECTDLGVAKVVSNTAPLVGNQVRFTIQVRNNSSNNVTNAVLTEVLPRGFRYESSIGQGIFDPSTGIWNLGAIQAGAEAVLEVTGTATTVGCFTNAVKINSERRDWNLLNNVSYATMCTATDKVNYADLDLTKSVNNAAPQVGEEITFTIALRNNGTNFANNIRVRDLIPENISNVTFVNTTQGTFDPATGLWSVGVLQVDGSAVLSFKGTVNREGRFRNHVYVQETNMPDPTPAEASVEVNPVPPVGNIDLAVTKTVNPAVAQPGSNVAYTLTFRNLGNRIATNVRAVDILPQGVTYVSHSFAPSTGMSYNPNNGQISLGNLAAGASVLMTINVTVNANVAGGSSILNIVNNLQATEPDNNPSNNQATATFTTPSPIITDIQITQTVDNPTPNAGDLVRFTIVVRNNGPHPAENVVVMDNLPTGVSYFSPLTTATVGTYNGATGKWIIGNLAVGETQTLTLVGTVNSNATAAMTNTAMVTTSTTETTLANNTSVTVLTPTGCSSGHDGGVESNNYNLEGLNLINTKFAYRNGVFVNLFGDENPDEMTPAYKVARQRFIERFMTKAEGPQESAKTDVSRLAAYVPSAGPQGATSVEVTPTWLIQDNATNATDVYALDYKYANDKRVASVLAFASGTALYDHTKNTCDRLGGSTLEEVTAVQVEDQTFLVSKLPSPQNLGMMDYGISFVAYKTASGFQIDSKFASKDYAIPTGTQEVLTFQVWGAAPEFARQMTAEVISKLKAQGAVSYLNGANTVPTVFIRKGRYDGGDLILEVANGAGATQLTLTGTVSTSETDATRSNRTWNVALDPSKPIQEVRIPAGSIFDAQFTLTNNLNADKDELYFADGAWGYNSANGAGITAFNVNGADNRPTQIGTVNILRGATMTGTVNTGSTNFASMFRYLKAGRGVLNLVEEGKLSRIAANQAENDPDGIRIDAIQFELNGVTSGTVDVVIFRKGVSGWDGYRKTFPITAATRNYVSYLNEFKRNNQEALTTALATDLELIAFYVNGNANSTQPFSMSVQNVRFGDYRIIPTDGTESEIPKEVSLDQNYPNPFKEVATIRFGLPNSGNVRLEVFDMLGRKVDTLVDGNLEAGIHNVTLNASQLASGQYVYRLVADGKVLSKSLVIVK